MSGSLQIYIGLVVAGILLLGAEIYIPGGIMGLLGAAALVGALFVGFTVPMFGPFGGLVSALIIIAAGGAGLFFWLRYFPHSRFGRMLSLSQSIRKEDDQPSPLTELKGATGTTLSNLTPSGVAEINGRRIDVVADGSWIDKDTDIVVLEAQGNHLLVTQRN